MKELHKIHVNQKNAIFIIVDVENEFCSPGGKLFTEATARIIPGVFSSIRTLAEKCRKAQIPVIYIQSVRTLKEAANNVFKQPPILLKDTWVSEICQEVKPQAGDIVISKTSHDPFFRTELDDILGKLVPDPTRCYAIIAGGAVNVCVYHTTLGFHLRDYWTVLALDSVYYGSEKEYQVAIDQLSVVPAYPNVFFSRSDLIEITDDPELLENRPEPGT